jgi:two-component sensor histidine kinase
MEELTVDGENLVTINDVRCGNIPAEQATFLAVFINEAIQNSFQHAFDKLDPVYYLQISLDSQPSGEHSLTRTYCLTIRDSGVGIPENVLAGKGETLGFAIMTTMAEKLAARLEFPEGDGTRIELTFSATAGE